MPNQGKDLRAAPVRGETGFHAVAPARPWVTTAFCLAAIFVFALPALDMVPPWAAAGPQVDPRLGLIRMGAKSTALVSDAHEGWRVYSAHFVHTGWIHIVFNLAFLFPVAGALEAILKRADFCLLLAVIGTASGVFSLLWTPEVSAGASGLVFGTLAAAVVVGIRFQHRLGRRLRPYVGLWILPFLVVVVLAGAGNDSVDHANHLGGLVSGALMAFSLRLRSPFEPAATDHWRFSACVALVAVTIVAAPAMSHRGQPAGEYRLADAVEFSAPPRWRPTYDPVGEIVFHGSTSLVSFGVDVIPPEAEASWQAWYASEHLEPLERAELIDAPVCGPIDPQGPTPAFGAHSAATRCDYRRDGHATIRDIARVDLGELAVAVSFELPAEWADKYAETRVALLGSIRPSNAIAEPSPHAAVSAAIP